MTNVSPPYSDFGQDLAALRLNAGLTVSELANLSHCSPRNIRNLEAGTQRPQRGTLEHLARACDVSYERIARTLTAVPVAEGLTDSELERLAERLAPHLVKALRAELQPPQ